MNRPHKPSQLTAIFVLILAGLTIVPAFGANPIWNGSAGDDKWKTAGNWVGGTAPVSGDSLFFSGTVGVVNTNDFTAGTVFNGLNFNGPGAFTLWGNSVGLNGNITNNQTATPESINLPLTLNVTPTIDVISNGFVTISSPVSGGFGLVKTSAGQLTLAATNTFTGPLTVLGGTINVSNDFSLGVVPGSPVAGDLVLNTGTLLASNSLTINTNRGIALGPTTGAGLGTMDVLSGATLTYGGSIGNAGTNGGLVKLHFGTLALSSSNSYSGPTLVENGGLTLDFTQPSSPTNNIVNPVSALSLGGANAGQGTASRTILLLSPKAGTTNSQTFSSTFVDKGSAIIQVNSNNLSRASLALGVISHNPGAAASFVPPTMHGGPGNITTTSTNISGILGGWATMSDGTISAQGWTFATNWATVDGTGNLTNYSGFTVYTSGNVSTFLVQKTNNLQIPNNISGNLQVDADGAVSTNDVNTICVDRPDTGWTFAIGISNTLRLGTFGGILRRTNNVSTSLNFGGGASFSRITAGGPNPNTPGEIVLTTYQTDNANNNFAFNSSIVDNGTGPVTVIKAGSGYAALSASNGYSGGTYILGGRLRWNAGNCFSTGPVFVFPGGNTYVNAGTTITNSLFLAGSGTPQEPNIGAIRYGPNAAFFTGPITLIGDAEIGGQGGGCIIGPVSGPFKLIICALSTVNGDTALANTNNSWTGDTIITARTNTGNNSFTSSNSEVIPNGLGKGNVFMQGFSTGTIVWNMNGYSETINGLSTIGTASTCTILNSNASTLSTLTLGDNNQSGTFGGTIRDNFGAGGTIALQKIGGGTETFTSTNIYSGSTVVSNGVLALSGSGAISNSSSISVLSGATLDVSGKSGSFPLSPNPVTINGGTLSVGGARPTISNFSISNSVISVALNLTAPNVVAPSLTTGGTSNFVNIIAFPPITSYPTQFVIVQYSGAVAGAGNNFGLGTSPSAATAGYVTNDPTLSAIVLVLTNGPRALTWAGTDPVNPTFWDVDTTTNWLFGVVPAEFTPFDSVSFDDTGSTNLVTLQGALTPSIVSVNSTMNYTFTGTGSIMGTFDSMLKQGSGTLTLTENNGGGGDSFGGGVNVSGGTLIFAANNSIAGGTAISAGATAQVGTNGGTGNLPGGIVALGGNLIFDRGADLVVGNTISGSSGGTITKSDANTLTLSGANSFVAPLTVTAGTLRAGNPSALGATNGATTISSGASLDVNGQDLGAEPVLVQGAGVGGSGAIINNGASQVNALQFVTLQGNTIFGGSARWDIRSADILNPTLGNLLTGGAAYNVTKTGTNQVSLVGITVDSALGNIDVQQGMLSIETVTSGLGNNADTLTVEPGATLQLFQSTSLLDKNFVLNGNGVADTLLAGSSTGSGQNIIQPSTGTVTLNGSCVFDGPGYLTLNGTITGTGSLTKVGTGTNFLSGTITCSSGTTVNAGQLAIDGTKTAGAGITVAAAGALAGTGSTTESVTNNGTIIAGDPLNLPTGSLTVGNLTQNGGNVVVDVDNTSDSVVVNGNLTLTGVATIQLFTQNAFSGLTAGQKITVIQYSGSLSGALANLTLAVIPPGYSFSIVDPATTPGKIEVNVDHVPQPLTWLGHAPSAPTAWDGGITTNWLDNNGIVLATFTNGDNVTFDDNGTNLVTLTGSLIPLSVTVVSTTNSYTFTGSGRITGPTALTVDSPLTIENTGTNDFSGGVNIGIVGMLQVGAGGTNGSLGTGPVTNNVALVFDLTNNVTVSNNMSGTGMFTNEAGLLTLSGFSTNFTGPLVAGGGTLRAGSAFGLGSTNGGSILVSSNATLDLNGQNLGTKPVTVGGPGVGSNGAIISTAAAQQLNALQNVTLTGDTTFGGTGRWDIRSSVPGGATLSSSGNPYNLTKTGTNQVWMVDVSFDAAISNITVQAGLLGYQDGTTGLGNPLGTLTVDPGASLGFYDSVNPLNKIISLNGDGTNSSIVVDLGTNSVSGLVSLNGNCIFNLVSGTILQLSNSVTGSGSLTEIGNGTLAIDGAYSWGGNTTVSSGTLDLSGSGSPTLTLGTGQTLGGNGTIIGAMNAGANSTVEPGPAMSALSVSGAISLNGTTLMEVNQLSATNTVLSSTNSSITYGGTLVVTNLAGSFAGGETYKLFNSGIGSYLSSFASLQLPALSPGLSWNTNQLSVNGTISVSGSVVFAKPTISHVSVGGGNIVISGTNNSGPGGTYHVLTSTNIAVFLTNWTVLTNGSFDSNGNFSSTNATGTNARQFYILQVP